MQDYTVLITGFDQESYTDANKCVLEGRLFNILGPVLVQDAFRAAGMNATMRVTLRCAMGAAKVVLKSIQGATEAARNGHPIKVGGRLITIVLPDDAEKVYKEIHYKDVREPGGGGGGGGKMREMILERLSQLETALEEEQIAAREARALAEGMRQEIIQGRAEARAVEVGLTTQRQHLNMQLHSLNEQAQQQKQAREVFQNSLMQGVKAGFEVLTGQFMRKFELLEAKPATLAQKMLTPPRGGGSTSEAPAALAAAPACEESAAAERMRAELPETTGVTRAAEARFVRTAASAEAQSGHLDKRLGQTQAQPEELKQRAQEQMASLAIFKYERLQRLNADIEVLSGKMGRKIEMLQVQPTHVGLKRLSPVCRTPCVARRL